MFLNFSNHPFAMWSDIQIEEAGKYGEIVDLSFPNIPGKLSKDEVMILVEEYLKKVEELNPDIVMCQGEFTFTFNMVNALKKRGVKVVSACAERNVIEYFDGNINKKEAEFVFLGFREY